MFKINQGWSMKNLNRSVNAEGMVYLNVASSVHCLDNFINLDNHVFLRFITIYPFLKPLIPKKYVGFVEELQKATCDYVLIRHDCRKPLPVPDNSVDHILCSHFLEHVYPDEAVKILDNFYSVLKPLATLHVIVPDLERLVASYLTAKQKNAPSAADSFIESTILSSRTRPTKKFRLLELIGGFGLNHRWMYDRASMQIRLENAGFEILNENPTPSADYRCDDGSVHWVARKPVSLSR